MGIAPEGLPPRTRRDAIAMTESPRYRPEGTSSRRSRESAFLFGTPTRLAGWARRFGLVAVGCLAVGALVGWSAATVFAPTRDSGVGTAAPTAQVREGTVGSSLPLAVSAAWTPDSTARNSATGTVTSVADLSGAPTSSGTTLYSVDLRPVVAINGQVPSFRTLDAGAAGADVKQLQTYLHEAGFMTSQPDGTFNVATAQAVAAWHRGNGLPPDASVDSGEIVFVPNLPRRLELDTKLVQVGSQLAGGEQTVLALSEAPTFTSHLSTSATSVLKSGMPVSIRGPKNETWDAEAGAPSTVDGDTVVTLKAHGGGAPCGENCGELSTSGATVLSGTLVVSPTRHGLTIPSAALRSAADGRAFLTGTDGKRYFVTVVTSADGLSLVDGVAKGLRVRLHAGS